MCESSKPTTSVIAAAASSRDPLCPPPSRATTQFSNLPIELRDLIWEHAAPPSRLFHVRRFDSVPTPVPDSPLPPHRPADAKTRRPRFYVFHPPPAITAICADSRRVALRLGFFLLPASRHSDSGDPSADPDSAVWFNTATDVLYLERGLRRSLSTLRLRCPGLDRVRRVGVEWRWFFADGSIPLSEYSSPPVLPLWVARMSALYDHFPAMSALHYVLPRTRYQGGIPWGREPDGCGHLGGTLVDLPGRITIPLESGHKPWADVGQELRRAIRHEDVASRVEEGAGRRVCFPPAIVGAWLVRDLLPETFKSPYVKVFDW
ncbi:uncharacterized protein DNG_00880 [Cephalotrichum gorgonifer]|uniref:2EXR domain-containing protein n=1 Tax=Cephalotrichum gorgonifer TaxID=2041049 RepID=A0AAE8MR23_9PEZI|nr:uncharacterized protein DNG_00880 [Cephalotrichum gorgonifer]